MVLTPNPIHPIPIPTKIMRSSTAATTANLTSSITMMTMMTLTMILLAHANYHAVTSTVSSSPAILRVQPYTRNLAFISPKRSSSSSSSSSPLISSASKVSTPSSRVANDGVILPTVFEMPNTNYRRMAMTPLYTTIDPSVETNNYKINDVIQRLELNQQFERWRFFQRLLEGELPPSDIEDVLSLALRAYLDHGPTATSVNNKDENGGNASPVLTEEQRAAMEGLVDAMESVSDGIGDSRFMHMLVLPPVDYETLVIDVEETTAIGDDVDDGIVAVDPAALSILQRLEQLLPDPKEDEEAFQSSWDVVIDLFGRESVRVKEEALQREEECRGIGSGGGGGSFECDAENLQWRTVCTVGRVLIHFDFLTKGVLVEGTFQ